MADAAQRVGAELSELAQRVDEGTLAQERVNEREGWSEKRVHESGRWLTKR